MKKTKDQKELQDTISRELGIDLSKYRNEEVADDLVDLLVFPKYIFKWIARPILIALLVYILGFFFIDLVHIQFLIYGIIGLVLFFVVGLFGGILTLTRKLTEDLLGISEYSLGVLKNSMLDIDNVGSRVNKNNIKDVSAMLFQGVIHLVTIPMLSKAIENKVPIASGLVKGVLKRALMAISNRMTFDDEKIDETIIGDSGDPKFITNYLSAINYTGKGLSGTLGVVTKVVRAPFKFGFYLFLILLGLFIYLIW